MSENIKSMSTTAVSDRLYNKYRISVQPSYLELLCKQGKIAHSYIPNYDGRKSDVCTIPETELDNIVIMLKEDKPMDEKKYTLSVKEVAEILGLQTTTVNLMVRNGTLKANKVNSPGKGRYGYTYMFNEDDVQDYMEYKDQKKSSKKKVAAKPKESRPTIEQDAMKDELETLRKRVQYLCEANTSLKASNEGYTRVITKLHTEVKNLKDELSKEVKAETRTLRKEEYIKAYNKGFEDGYSFAKGERR